MARTQLESPQAHVAQLFISFFNRAPEFEALNYFVGRLQHFQDANPGSFDNAFKALAREVYYTGQANGEAPPDDEFSHRSYVSDMYANVLGRNAADDPAGWAYWTGTLDRGENTIDTLLAVFLASAREGSRDSEYLANRTHVALEFARPQNSGPEALPTLQYDSAMVLEGVNEDPATVEAAHSRLIWHPDGPETPVLYLHAANWTSATNSIDITLQFASDLVFDHLDVDGVHSMSLSQSSVTRGGTTILNLRAELANGSDAGDLHFVFDPTATSLAGREIVIMSVSVNGASMENVHYPLDNPGFAVVVGANVRMAYALADNDGDTLDIGLGEPFGDSAIADEDKLADTGLSHTASGSTYAPGDSEAYPQADVSTPPLASDLAEFVA